MGIYSWNFNSKSKVIQINFSFVLDVIDTLLKSFLIYVELKIELKWSLNFPMVNSHMIVFKSPEKNYLTTEDGSSVQE